MRQWIRKSKMKGTSKNTHPLKYQLNSSKPLRYLSVILRKISPKALFAKILMKFEIWMM